MKTHLLRTYTSDFMTFKHAGHNKDQLLIRKLGIGEFKGKEEYNLYNLLNTDMIISEYNNQLIIRINLKPEENI